VFTTGNSKMIFSSSLFTNIRLFFSRQLKRSLRSPNKRSKRILNDPSLRDPLKVGILGCGRLGSQLTHCLITFGNIDPEDIKISTRRPETLGKTFFFKLELCLFLIFQ